MGDTMKRIIILIIALSLMILLKMNAATAEELQNGMRVQRIYNSIEPKDSNNLKIASINLSKHNYSKVYQYVLTENSLFLIGTTKSGIYEFSSIFLNDQKKNKISTYPSALSIQGLRFTVFEMPKLATSTFVIVENIEGNIKYIEIYHGIDGHDFQKLKKEEVSLESRIFISDNNDDGFADILVWRKAEGSNINNAGEMTFMQFNPDVLNLSDLKILRTNDSMY